MTNEYMPDMKKAFEKAGIKNVRVADVNKWSNGDVIRDGIDVLFDNSRDREQSDLSSFGTQGEQFNLIGYSYGGLQAAQAAADYADKGGIVDNLVLMATPIEKGFLAKLRNNKNIKSVRIINLPEQDDLIRAGDTDLDVVTALPKLVWQKTKGLMGPEVGHFYYSDATKDG